MRVDCIQVVPVARGARLEARVRYDDRPRRPETAWFEVPDALAGALDPTSGDPFLAAFLPLAHALRQPLELEAPVDAALRAGALEVPAVWHRWYGVPASVEVRGPVRAAPPPTAGRRGAFFSGGVDSTYTALAGAGLAPAGAPWLDELWFVEGFDLRLRARRGARAAVAAATEAARALGLPLHALRTNLRDTRWGEADWALVAHGPLLAALAHVLGRRVGAAWVAASVSGGEDAPWGSHPATDAPLSSSTLAVRHHGFGVERVDKLRAVAAVPGALDRLRVCWVSRDGDNCGACTKCVQARAMVDGVAGPDAAPCLPRPRDFLARLRAHPLTGSHDARNLEAIATAARARGLLDVAAAAEAARGGAPVPDRVAVKVPRSRRPAWWRRRAP